MNEEVKYVYISVQTCLVHSVFKKKIFLTSNFRKMEVTFSVKRLGMPSLDLSHDPRTGSLSVVHKLYTAVCLGFKYNGFSLFIFFSKVPHVSSYYATCNNMQL